MARSFEELAREQTPAGTVTLWRRTDPVLGADVFEVKLGDEFLMSSHFTAGEVALTTLGLAALDDTAAGLTVVVGGMGLGYTAQAALDDPRVEELLVVEAVDTVLGFHRDALLPDVAGLVPDPRTRLVHGDFFALARDDGFDPDAPGRTFDAILLDVDHTPTHLLHPSHADLYTTDGLHRLQRFLRPGGVFALWSDARDDAFLAVLSAAFADAEQHVVTFPNPLTSGESSNVVFVAR